MQKVRALKGAIRANEKKKKHGERVPVVGLGDPLAAQIRTNKSAAAAAALQTHASKSVVAAHTRVSKSAAAHTHVKKSAARADKSVATATAEQVHVEKRATTTTTTAAAAAKRHARKGEVEEEEEPAQIETALEEDEQYLSDLNAIANAKTRKNEVIDSKLTFESLGLHPELCKMCTKLGYLNPTNIQRDSIPHAIQGKDLIAIAETGSGKTAAFALPVIHSLLQLNAKPTPCTSLILAPTRELASQIKDHFDALGSEIGLKTVLLVGGMPMLPQQMQIRERKPHIVIGTPGRIAEHLRATSEFKIFKTKFLILDEADKMLGVEFEEELNLIFSQLDTKNCQILLFSATMTKKVEKLQKAHLKDPVKVQVTASKYATVSTLKQEYLFIPEKFKEVYLAYLLNENAGKRILVFASQNVTCITLSIVLRSLNFPAVPLAGHMNEVDRMHCLRKFKTGDRPILIATDVAARGLDIPLVELVINFDIPVHSKEYVHRVGRTARIGKEGRAITIVSQYDIEYFQKIEQLIGFKMDQCKVEKEHVQVLSNTVSKALQLAKTRVKQKMPGQPTKGDESVNDEEDVLQSAIHELSKRREAASGNNKKRPPTSQKPSNKGQPVSKKAKKKQ